MFNNNKNKPLYINKKKKKSLPISFLSNTNKHISHNKKNMQFNTYNYMFNTFSQITFLTSIIGRDSTYIRVMK